MMTSAHYKNNVYNCRGNIKKKDSSIFDKLSVKLDPQSFALCSVCVLSSASTCRRQRWENFSPLMLPLLKTS